MSASTLSLSEPPDRGPQLIPNGAPPPAARRSLRVLFLVSAHNSLSQRAQIALSVLGHDVTVAVVDSRVRSTDGRCLEIHARMGTRGGGETHCLALRLRLAPLGS